MALFQSYAKPGVYTSVQIESAGQSLFGNARIPVLIGEGLQYFTFNNAELIRGSSAVADNQVVDEDLSGQVTGLTNQFQVTYFPVTDGTGKGVVTNDPSKIIVTSEGLPLTVVSLTGASGQFITQELIPLGNDLHVSYYFKRTDTLITNEDLSAQIPTFATLVYGTLPNQLTFSLSIPGDLGNDVTLAFVDPGSGHGVSDALAVSGAGTTAISINIRTPGNTFRPFSDIVSLVTAGIPTAYGNLTVTLTGSGATSTTTLSPTPFSGGAGPQTNTVFQTHYAPIVDGTNGGVVTTNPALVTVLVNGHQATVSALNGQRGLVTLATDGVVVPLSGVAAGSTLTITYYINQYQYTSDILPGTVATISQVGLGPNRSDFIQGTDFELNQSGTQIAWGANADTAAGSTNPLSSATFGPTQITTTLVDEQVWLRQASGSVNGVNASFVLQDVPVDGSGLARPLGNPAYARPQVPALETFPIAVYVGPDPVTALEAGAVRIAAIDGASATVVLYNPPALGNNVYASYYRSQLNDHTFTLTVVNPGIPGQGTYSVKNELNQVVPSTAIGVAHVFQSGPFAQTGIVWPNNFPDLDAEPNDQTETVTITFQDDDLHLPTNPPVQATDTVIFPSTSGLLFTATEIGVIGPDFTAPNGVTGLTFVSNALEPISTVGTYGSSPVYSGTKFFSGATPLLFTAPLAQWQALTAYAVGDAIYDPGTLSIQVVTSAGTTGGTIPTFSATAGTHSTPSPDGTVVWTSNGLAPASAELIFVNIVGTTGTRKLSDIIALFSSPNVVSTPLAGQITVTLTPGSSPSTLATALPLSYFEGGVNGASVDYANRFLVTSSIASAGGTGQATTPATANVNASVPWAINTAYKAGQIVSITVTAVNYIIQAQNAGMSGATAPSWNTTTGATTVDNTITWKTLGPEIVPVGANGYLGQTYIDLRTGVKFTIVDPAEALHYGYTQLPSPQYNFMPGDTLTFNISQTAPFVTGVTPIINIGGLRVIVQTTFGTTAGDTALISTFKGDANEPNVGEYYYVSYTVNKTPADMALKLYTNPADAYAAYGPPNTVNRLSLGVQLLTGNGAQQFGCIQVPQQPGQNVASDANYEAAIQSLSMALPGTQNKVNVICPLSTSNAVAQYLSRFLTTQAAPRQKGEAIGFVGMSLYDTPQTASALANALMNARMILVAPFAFGIQITNPTTGVAIEYAVEGCFPAAAMAGLNCNPANDVATSLTNQNVVGFSRILQRLDDPTMDLMAANGVTLLIEQSGGLQVRHYKSTDPSNIITSEPTCTTITDYVCQQFRSDLKQFIGRKLIGSILGSIQVVCNGRLKSLVDAQIIQGYTAPQVKQDPLDPTTVDISVTFQPVFTLLYIGVTFTVTSSSVSSSGSATGSGQTGTGSGA
jgi:hypothetical protein